jgi:class 3 adenylate cyclase
MGPQRENAMAFAVVAKRGPRGLQFLTPRGSASAWSSAGHLAVRFADVRAATRTALALPARDCAFALPTAGLLGAR